MEVIHDSDSGWRFVYWNVLSREFSVAEGHPAGAVHAHNVLVIFADFNNNTCFVPLSEVIASLVLNTHLMTNFEWGKLASFMCWFLRASLRVAKVSCQVGCGWYWPGGLV